MYYQLYKFKYIISKFIIFVKQYKNYNDLLLLSSSGIDKLLYIIF